MKVCFALFLILFPACASANSLNQGTGVTPLTKVVQLLKGMILSGETEMEAEAENYQKYSQFCHDTAIHKQHEIKNANQAIESLSAAIQKAESDINKFQNKIEALDGDIAIWESDKQSATAVRATDSSDYTAAHDDYSESVDALERAIAVLQKRDFSQAQTLLMQVTSLKKIPDAAKRAITIFMSQDPEVDGYLGETAPEAYAYEFQSGGVIDMLKKLKNKFEDEVADLERQETKSKHAYAMLVQDLENQIATATDNRNEMAQTKSRVEEQLSDDKAELTTTTVARDADEKYSADLSAECAAKATQFAARQKLRKDELEVIHEAIDILKTKVKALADKHLPMLLARSSFVQIRSRSRNIVQQRVAAFLRRAAAKINSRILFQLANQASEDPFKKVKQMIQDLITRLLEEANEEAEHKGWCDTEMSSNERTRKEKSHVIDELTSRIDILAAEVAELAQSISDLTQAVAAIDTTVAEQTEQRTTEKASNEQTIKEAKDAQEALSQALGVLKEFYVNAAEATALQQASIPGAPDTWDEAYTGMQASTGGVVGLLEVIQSDFARLEAETSSDEMQAAAEYRMFMQDAQLDRLAKSKDIEHATTQKEHTDAAHAAAVSDRESAQSELDAALAYYEKLKPSCLDASVEYDDRVGRRRQEIESLQEALRILNGETFSE